MGETAKFERYFEVITEVSRALNESGDMKQALSVMVQTIAAVFEAKGCLLRLLDPAGRELELLAATGLSSAYLEKGTVIAGRDVSEIFGQKIVVIEDVANDPRIQYPQAAVQEGIVFIIGVPFQISGSMRMVLRIYFDRRLELDDQDRRFIYHLAQQTATVIKSAMVSTRYMDAFRQITSAIHAGEEIGEILESIVVNIREIMEARGCIYWIVDISRRNVHMKVTSGFQMEQLSRISYETLEDVFRFHEEKEVFYKDVRQDRRIPSASSLGKQMVTAILGIPFHIVDQYKGILAVYFSREPRLLESQINFIRDAGRQGAIALHRAFRYDERTVKAVRETIGGLVMALEAKDVCTHGHSLNVANYSRLTALAIGLPERQADVLFNAGLLHDIGKIAMENNLLDNLGNLSPGDFQTIKRHPEIGAKIIRSLSFLDEVVPLVLHHHERHDGSGYPEGLTGKAIPLGARIIAVCDSFDAMTSERPGTERVSVPKACGILHTLAGTRFDPDVVSAFIQAIERHPEAVKPYVLPEQHAAALKPKTGSPDGKSLIPDWIRKALPGF
jgi:putative nucleotidyltransferase with HDIG domain